MCLYFCWSLRDKGCYNYIFIDEITAFDGFYSGSAILADGFSGSGMHIVVAGTDSLILWVASADPLFDRYVDIDTTYISFKEYSAIMSNTNVDVYLTDWGGVCLNAMKLKLINQS